MSLALAQVKGQAHTATSPPKSWKEKQEGEIDLGKQVERSLRTT